MRKIFESQIINEQTGEILTTRTIKSGSYNETFLFARTTDGLEWINEFKNLQDLRTLMYMVEFQEPKSGVIIFTKLQIEACAEFFKCTTKTIRNSISNLINTKFIVRIANNNYFSNPYTFYKGGSLALIERIKTWNNLIKDNK